LLRRLTTYRVVVAALVALLAVVVVGNSPGTTVTDIKPEVYLAPGEMVGRYLSAWTSSPYLGFPNFNVGLAPVVAFLAPIASTGLSAELLFKGFHLALWLVAAAGAGRALRCLVPDASAWAGLVAAVAYVANPYAVVGGSTLAVLLPYAFLPWLVVALVRALRDAQAWRWPAAFGLTFFAMSGMNVGVVPLLQLLVVPPIAVVVGRSSNLTWLAIGKVLVRCALFVVGVSLYWLVPAVAAARTGVLAASQSERIEGIAHVSSLVEVLRGMGMWSMYGSGPSGPWVPEFAPYLSNPVLVCVTLAWPVLALLALAGAPKVLRHVSAATIGLVCVVLVGFFPGTVSTPLAWVVSRGFELLPALVAFRTTNKAGAVLALVFALLLGHALPRWVAALAGSRRRVVGAIVVIGSLVAGWALPALSGNLYTSPVDVPDYWHEAAQAVDGAGHDSRVLLLPNQVRASYRWTDERPDDVTNSVMRRGAIIPESSPNASAPGANFLSALGDLVASGSAGVDTVSTMARYLGSGDILLRHDTRWEEAAGVRPEVSASMLGADPGLLGMSNFGRPGENVVGPAGAAGFESILPPVQRYGVKDALPTVSARSIGDEVTVAGDAWAFDGLARTGRLTSTPVVSYAQGATPKELATRLGTEHRLVLTDTNRRQAAIPNRLTAGYGPLLPESETPVPTRALGDGKAQTVLRRTGPTVTASLVGSAFYDIPYGQADNAVDGDPATSWLFGDFEQARGVTLDVRWPEARPLGVVTIRPTALGPVRLDKVTLTAGDVSRSVQLLDGGLAEVDLGGVVSDHVQLRVDDIRGRGFSLVGIAELGLPGPSVVRVARAPLSFDDLYAGLDDEGRRSFAVTPFDVSFTRVVNGSGRFDDSETNLVRDFSLPTGRVFTGLARVTMLDRSEQAFDRLERPATSPVATSSSIYFDNPELRASMASDEDSGTAWVPGSDSPGSWWQIVGPDRPVPAVVVEQRRSSSSAPTRTATRLAVEVDGVRVAEATASAGRTEVVLPQGTRGKVVRLVILDVDGPEAGLPPQFTSIHTGVTTPSMSQPGCATVAMLDGRPVRMRPQSISGMAQASDRGSTWEACSTVTLNAGQHMLRPVDGFVLDTLDLSDVVDSEPAAGQAVNLVTSMTGPDVDQAIQVAATTHPIALKIGQSFDPRWRASVDGVDLGPAQVIDGWSTGWVLGPGPPRTVQVQFEPQRAASLALWASAAVALGAVGIVLFGRRSSPRAVGIPDDQSQRPLAAVPLTRAANATVGLAAGVGFGVAGLVGWVVAALVHRLPVPGRNPGVVIGTALVAAGGLTQVLSSRGSWGMVDAAVPAASMWPHWLAVVGLVLTLVSAWRVDADRPLPEEDDSE